jgi:hypothetical protein
LRLLSVRKDLLAPIDEYGSSVLSRMLLSGDYATFKSLFNISWKTDIDLLKDIIEAMQNEKYREIYDIEDKVANEISVEAGDKLLILSD